jgi:hypothetical protein
MQSGRETVENQHLDVESEPKAQENQISSTHAAPFSIAGLKGSDLSETPYWGMLFVSSAGIWGMPVNASQDKDRPAWPTKI